ncbi:hypothetical protein ACHAWF_003521 [Thalassiosira exigua]
MNLLDAPASSPAATPPSSPALLSVSDIEALERGALMCLVSFKRLDGDSWYDAPPRAAPVSPTTVVDEPAVAAAPAPPPPPSSLPPKKRIRRAYVVPIEVDADPVDSDLSDPDYEPPRKKKTLGRKPKLPPFAEPTAEAAPQASEVVPPSSLYAPGDEDRINPTHNVLRRDVLELFVEPSRGGRARFAGKVGLRCRFCKHLPDRDRAPLSTVYPETLGGIYRACSVRFQKRHLTECAHVPRRVREELDALGSSNARGSKGHWIRSAKKKGLRDCEGGKKGIVFRPELVDV